MTVSNILGSFIQPYPYSGGQIFPDNGLITTNYDKRVTQNDRLSVGRGIMHEDDTYAREEKLDGSGIYTWNPIFIDKITQSLSENKIANFSREQKALWDKWIIMAKNGPTGLEPEDVKTLDAYLGAI